MKKVQLYCVKINNEEIKTISLKERRNFIISRLKNMTGYEQFTWEIPEEKLEKALEYSYDELHKFKLKENQKKTLEGNK